MKGIVEVESSNFQKLRADELLSRVLGENKLFRSKVKNPEIRLGGSPMLSPPVSTELRGPVAHTLKT